MHLKNLEEEKRIRLITVEVRGVIVGTGKAILETGKAIVETEEIIGDPDPEKIGDAEMIETTEGREGTVHPNPEVLHPHHLPQGHLRAQTNPQILKVNSQTLRI